MRDSSLSLALLVVIAGAISAAAMVAGNDPQYAPAARASECATAIKAFVEARVGQREDPGVLFNRGCAAASAAERLQEPEAYDEAIRWFLQAAMSEEERLAARAHYNLGTIAVRRALVLFGAEPGVAPPALRQRGLALMTQAAAHYRDALDLDPRQADARFNLEFLRLWIHRMEVIWSQRDRRDQRRQLGLLELLKCAEKEQRELLAQSQALIEQPDSPVRRETAYELGALQQLLSEEMGTLTKKISLELEVSGLGASWEFGPVPPSPRVIDGVIETLTDLAEETKREMFAAAECLRKGPLEEAPPCQASAVELLDEMRLFWLPFYGLIDEALELQRRLVDAVTPLEKEGTVRSHVELDKLAWDQQFVARWSQQLPVKAEESLQGLQVNFRRPEGAPEDGSEPVADSPLWEALAACVEKIGKLAPQVHDLAKQAACDLSARNPSLALPRQREAAGLLEAMFHALPRQAKAACQQRHGQESLSEPPETRRPSIPSGAPSNGLEKQPSAGSDLEPSGPRQSRVLQLSHPDGLSPQYVEAMMRRVRERQQRRRFLEEQFLQSQPAPVEKDW